MATASALEYQQSESFNSRATDDKLVYDMHGWGFVCLLLVVGTLFIRPTDLLPQLKDVSIYRALILTAIFVAYRAVGTQLSWRKLSENPVTACCIVLIASVAASHLANGFFWGARDSAWTATKVFALYLLIIGVVNSPGRLEVFARWLALAIAVMSSLALADHFGYVKLAAFSPVSENYPAGGNGGAGIERIRGSGIFDDPNDFGLMVVVGIVLTTHFLTRPGQGWPRYLWLVPGILLCITLYQTYSRGAFLALAATIPAWVYFHRGWRLAIVGTLVLVPIVAIPFLGRMTELNAVYEGTGQTRIQIWSDCLQMFRDAPLLGIGEGMLAERYNFVGHNSFLQSYVELGFIGGTVFIAVFLTAVAGLLPQSDVQDATEEQSNIRLRGAVFAVSIGYAIGIHTLSRQFVAPTFLVLGLAAASQLNSPYPIPNSLRFGRELAIRSTFIGIVFLAAMYVFVRLMINGV